MSRLTECPILRPGPRPAPATAEKAEKEKLTEMAKAGIIAPGDTQANPTLPAPAAPRTKEGVYADLKLRNPNIPDKVIRDNVDARLDYEKKNPEWRAEPKWIAGQGPVEQALANSTLTPAQRALLSNESVPLNVRTAAAQAYNENGAPAAPNTGVPGQSPEGTKPRTLEQLSRGPGDASPAAQIAGGYQLTADGTVTTPSGYVIPAVAGGAVAGGGARGVLTDTRGGPVNPQNQIVQQALSNPASALPANVRNVLANPNVPLELKMALINNNGQLPLNTTLVPVIDPKATGGPRIGPAPARPAATPAAAPAAGPGSTALADGLKASGAAAVQTLTGSATEVTRAQLAGHMKDVWTNPTNGATSVPGMVGQVLLSGVDLAVSGVYMTGATIADGARQTVNDSKSNYESCTGTLCRAAYRTQGVVGNVVVHVTNPASGGMNTLALLPAGKVLGVTRQVGATVNMVQGSARVVDGAVAGDKGQFWSGVLQAAVGSTVRFEHPLAHTIQTRVGNMYGRTAEAGAKAAVYTGRTVAVVEIAHPVTEAQFHGGGHSGGEHSSGGQQGQPARNECPVEAAFGSSLNGPLTTMTPVFTLLVR